MSRSCEPGYHNWQEHAESEYGTVYKCIKCGKTELEP